MKLSTIVDVAVSGLVAQRARLAASASNLANAQTTRTPEGGPYRRRDPVFGTQPMAPAFSDRLERAVRGVRTLRMQVDARPPVERFQPSHPDADENGIVRLPRVNPLEEMVNAMSARRSYEANLLILRKAREMGQAALQIGR